MRSPGRRSATARWPRRAQVKETCRIRRRCPLAGILQGLRTRCRPETSACGLRTVAPIGSKNGGRSPKVVSERLGHASIGITLDTYSHVMHGMQEEAAEKIDAGLRKALA